MAAKSKLPVDIVRLIPRESVRTFQWGTVYSLKFLTRYCLLIWEIDAAEATVYSYTSLFEFEDDRQKVLNFGDGPAGANVPAPTRPTPPTRTDALSIPFSVAME